MRKELDTRVVIAVVAIVVIVVAALAVRTWTAPSAPVANPASGRARYDPRRDGPPGPTPEAMREIQKWKEQHPDARTRF